MVSHRPSQIALEFANSQEAADWSQRGTLTPDHVIRTKGLPLLVNNLYDKLENDELLYNTLSERVQYYINQYHDYFNRQNSTSIEKKVLIFLLIEMLKILIQIELDPLPRVLLIEGVGLVTVGLTYKETQISADIYEHTIETIRGKIFHFFILLTYPSRCYGSRFL